MTSSAASDPQPSQQQATGICPATTRTTPSPPSSPVRTFLRAFAEAGRAPGPLGLAATGAWLALSTDEQDQALVLLRRALPALALALPALHPLVLHPLAVVFAAD